jgi:peptide/nickel transport system permease protein
MLKIILKRILLGVLTLIGTSFFIFWVNDLIPVDYATQVLGRNYSQATAEVVREKFGLYAPVITRYLSWLGNTLTGSFGTSWAGQDIHAVVSLRIERSLWLALLSAFVMFPVALSLGIYSALNRYSKKDRGILILNTMMLSTPEFLVGYIMVGLFAVKISIFPSLALVADDAPLGEKLYASVLPILTLAFVTVPPVMRIIRSALINSLNSEYVEMAILKGISPLRIMSYHVLPNNIGAIANAAALGMANLIAGIIIVEVVFVYPGMGSLLLGSIYSQDVPMILACATILASVYIILLMIADIVSIASNPRLTSKTQMHILHPGQVVKSLKYAPVVMVLGMAAYVYQYIPDEEPVFETDIKLGKSIPVSGSDRIYALADELLENDLITAEAVNNLRFMPRGITSNPIHEFNGALSIEKTRLLGRRAGGKPRYGFGNFPAVDLEFISDGDVLIPVARDFLKSDENGWAMLVGEGRIWSERNDRGYSRASFPFTLVGRKGGDSHAGIGMFVFDKNKTSNLRFQIVQETSLSNKFTAWGQANVTYNSTIAQNKGDLLVEARHYRNLKTKRSPWQQLESKYGKELMQYFDGERFQRNVTSSGMIIDGVIYQRPCQTRFGDFPYCEEMRHSVFSVTKSMGAGVAMAYLMGLYGTDVMDEKILDYLPISANHQGWKNVRFQDALNMATGIGDIVPEKVDFYVDSDKGDDSKRMFGAHTLREIFSAVNQFKNYPWSPGEVLRYRTVDTFILTIAMDRYLKSKQGPEAMLWETLNREVFQPIGIRYLPTIHSYDRNPYNRIPHLGYQLFPTMDDVAKVVQLLRNFGEHQGKQLLDRDIVRRMIEPTATTGLRSGWYYRRGGEARYNLSYWLIPYFAIEGCSSIIPAMVGVGGNYVIVMPNGITTVRFADRYEDNPGTYDTYHMRRISDHIKSVCQ